MAMITYGGMSHGGYPLGGLYSGGMTRAEALARAREAKARKRAKASEYVPLTLSRKKDKFMDQEGELEAKLANLKLASEMAKASLQDVIDELHIKERIFGRKRGVKKDESGLSYYDKGTKYFKGEKDWTEADYKGLDEYLTSKGFGEEEDMEDEEGGLMLGGAKRRRGVRKAKATKGRKRRTPAQVRATKKLVAMNKARAKARRSRR